MSYSTYLVLLLATLRSHHPDLAPSPTPNLDTALQPALDALHALVESFRHVPITPAGTARFEADVQTKVDPIV